MLAAADDASALLKALANRHRLIIICQLIERERSVGELATLLHIRDSTVSQHLALLRKDGIVTARRDGQTIWYSIGSPQASELVDALYRVYCAAPSANSHRRKPLRATRRRHLAPDQ
ncbi:MAG TPA: metalloregulator ArsR/SmtB family transcription factor [Xanthobacteraceae bacterium]|nr:metalloregulator ArsR/SmtB family transcription factor [Xanthobacteraceae bacterium]